MQAILPLYGFSSAPVARRLGRMRCSQQDGGRQNAASILLADESAS